jgi:XXXCH domain-containing protein
MMSQSKSHKNEMVLAPVDAADLLRRLAEQLEAGGVEIGQVTVENDGPVKIKQSIKTKSDRVSFKLKLKYETPLTPELNGALGQLPEEEPDEDEDESLELARQPESSEAQPAEPADEPAAKAAEESAQESAEEPAAKPAKKAKAPTKKKKPSYKTLKKGMGKTFKAMKQTLAEGGMPSLEEINSFAQNCELMTSYKGKGEPNYQEFLSCVNEFKEAGETGDAEALAQAVAALGAMKKSCHSQFK